MRKIVYLPLDERPCNAKFPAKLLENNAEFLLVTAPREILGDKKTPAKYGAVEEFLVRETADADCLVLSVDTLLYGGIVPSRLHGETREELKKRLSLVRTLRDKNPKMTIYAFHLLMPCPQYSSDDEEPFYYGICGREIFLTGELRDRRDLSLDYDAEKLAELEKKTAPYLEDYLSRRAVNLEMDFMSVDMAGGAIDYLVLPQDDSSVYGFIAQDQRKIRAYIREKNKQNVTAIYPGCDETGMTLIARYINSVKGAPRVDIRWASAFGPSVIPLYEDRPVGETIKYQLTAAGCVLDGAADFTLYVNVPSKDMTDANASGSFRSYEVERCLPEFVENIAWRVKRGGRAAVADIAYVNGGDAELVRMLEEKGCLFRLAAYAGWNTSSNSLGTAVFQASVYTHFGNTPEHEKFLALRYYEDVGYCSRVRKQICERFLPALGLNYFDAGGKRGAAADEVAKELNAYIGALLPEVAARFEVGEAVQPWARMFETDLEIIEKE